MLREGLGHVLLAYKKAVIEPFAGHPVAAFLRETLPFNSPDRSH